MAIRSSDICFLKFTFLGGPLKTSMFVLLVLKISGRLLPSKSRYADIDQSKIITVLMIDRDGYTI